MSSNNQNSTSASRILQQMTMEATARGKVDTKKIPPVAKSATKNQQMLRKGIPLSEGGTYSAAKSSLAVLSAPSSQTQTNIPKFPNALSNPSLIQLLSGPSSAQEQLQLIQVQQHAETALNQATQLILPLESQVNQSAQLAQLQPHSTVSGKKALPFVPLQPQVNSSLLTSDLQLLGSSKTPSVEKAQLQSPMLLQQLHDLQSTSASNQPLQLVQLQQQSRTASSGSGPVQLVQLPQQSSSTSAGTTPMQLIQLPQQSGTAGAMTKPVQLVQLQQQSSSSSAGSAPVQLVQLQQQSSSENTCSAPVQLVQLQQQSNSASSSTAAAPMQLVQLQQQPSTASSDSGHIQLVQLQQQFSTASSRTEPVQLVQLQQQSSTAISRTAPMQLVQLQQQSSTASSMTTPMQLIQLQSESSPTQKKNPLVQPVQLCQQPGATGSKVAPVQLVQLQPHSSAASLNNLSQLVQLQPQSTAGTELPLLQFQPQTISRPQAVSGTASNTPMQLVQFKGNLGSSKKNSLQQQIQLQQESGKQLFQLLQLQAAGSTTTDKQATLPPVIQVQQQGNALNHGSFPLAIAGSSNFPVVSRVAETANPSDMSESELLQSTIKSVIAGTAGQAPGLQNVELKMDSLKGQTTMPIIVGQDIKVCPSKTAEGGMSLTQNLQVAMVPVQDIATFQKMQAKTKFDPVEEKQQSSCEPVRESDPSSKVKPVKECSPASSKVEGSRHSSKKMPAKAPAKRTLQPLLFFAQPKNALIDFSQFNSIVKIDPGEKLEMPADPEMKRKGLKRKAETAGLDTSPSFSGMNSSASENSTASFSSGIKIAAPQNFRLESLLCSNNIEDNAEVPFATHSGEITGCKLSPSWLVDKEVEDDVAVETACVEVKSTEKTTQETEKPQTAGTEADGAADSLTEKCRVFPMYISSQTLTWKEVDRQRARQTRLLEKKQQVVQLVSAGMDSSGSTQEIKVENDLESSGINISLDPHNIDNDQQLGCYMCEFTTFDEASIVQHWIQAHVPDKPYVCSHCPMVFTTTARVSAHMRTWHPERPQVVSLKPSFFYRDTLLLEVEQLSESEDTAPVPPAKHYRESQIITEDHTGDIMEDAELASLLGKVLESQDSKPGKHQCKKCQIVYQSALDLKMHSMAAHKQVRPFVCFECNHTFVCAYDLRQHFMQRHEGGEMSREADQDVILPFGKLSNLRTAYTNQMLSDGTQVFKCEKCGLKTATETEMQDHIAHDGTCFTLQTKCKACGTSIDYKKLKRKKLFCPNCNIKVMIPKAKSLMMRVVHVCRLCEYKTEDKSGMTRHIKYSHTAFRPYKCAYCSFSSVEKPKVRIHLNNHHKHKPLEIIKDEQMLIRFKQCLPEIFKKMTYTINALSLKNKALARAGQGKMAILKYQNRKKVQQFESVVWRGLSEGKRSRPLMPLPQKAARDLTDITAGRSTMYIRQVSTTARGLLRCDLCGFTTKTWPRCVVHVRVKHMQDLESDMAPPITQLKNPHFSCNLCDYKTCDRSSISRHIKYTHISADPHSCPLCPYKRVEKTKVRIHMRSQHKRLADDLEVITDFDLLERASKEVKQYFSIVTSQGTFPVASPGEAKKTLPLRNVTQGLPPDTPVPQYMVVNVHAASKSAQLASSSGDIVNVNLAGYVKMEDGSLVKIEPGMNETDSQLLATGAAGETTFEVKTEPDNEYPGEGVCSPAPATASVPAGMEVDTHNHLELVSDVSQNHQDVATTPAEEGEMSEPQNSNIEENFDLKAVCESESSSEDEEPDCEDSAGDEDADDDEEDGDNQDDSSVDEDYHPDSESANDDAEWNMIVDQFSEMDQFDEMEKDAEGSALDNLNSETDDSNSETGDANEDDIHHDQKLREMKPVVVLKDIVDQILSGCGKV